MDSVTPLYVYPMDAWRDYRSGFASAKQGDRQLAAIQLKPEEAFPGCGRLIAFETPPFIAEYALVRSKPEDLPRDLCLTILRWYVGQQDDNRIVSYERALSRMLGAEVKEVWA